MGASCQDQSKASFPGINRQSWLIPALFDGKYWQNWSIQKYPYNPFWKCNKHWNHIYNPRTDIFPVRKVKKEKGRKSLRNLLYFLSVFEDNLYNDSAIISATSSLWEKYDVIISLPRLLFDIFLNHSDSGLPNVKIIPLNREDGSKTGIRYLKSKLVLM